jgi:hypothetical protein
MKPYKFVFHDRVPDIPPENKNYELVQSEIKLTRNQKDNIFHCIQGNSGNGYYKHAGWVFPFYHFMKTYLVKYNYVGWQEIKAFDKMCIRNSWYTNSGIIKIIELKT